MLELPCLGLECEVDHASFAQVTFCLVPKVRVNRTLRHSIHFLLGVLLIEEGANLCELSDEALVDSVEDHLVAGILVFFCQ